MKKIFAVLGLMLCGFASHAQSVVQLLPPNITGVACGLYQSSSSVTIVGFDTNGNIQASLTEVMSCSSGGRGSHPTIHTATGTVTWDFRGGYVTGFNAPLAIPVVGNVGTDSLGNVVTLGNHNFLAVTLTINQMPTSPVYLEAKVPNVVGLTDSAAKAALVAAGLQDGGAYINGNYSAPPGTVFNQHPVAGAIVPFATGVLLWETPANNIYCPTGCDSGND